jgi:uncharacterized protein YaaN involved in tellurite resistance
LEAENMYKSNTMVVKHLLKYIVVGEIIADEHSDMMFLFFLKDDHR